MGKVKAALKTTYLLCTALLLIATSACSGSYYPTTTPTPAGLFQVSVDLRDLYQSLGGEAELGPAISRQFTRNNRLCQFTTNVLMCLNPAIRSSQDRFYLDPIGRQISISAYGNRLPSPYKVYEGFYDTYTKKFFATRYAGEPISGVLYNSGKRRLEQYFEKMGFYTEIDDPQQAVHLLPYGVMACGAECSDYHTIPSANIKVDVLNPASLGRLGGYSVFGDPITVPYRAADGSYEQILEKVVVYIPVDNPATLRFRSVAVALNLPYNEPGPQKYGAEEKMVFYKVKGDLGYHVPEEFDQFIALHGGIEISGKPFSDPYEVPNSSPRIARQCFENYCLEYHPGLADGQRVQLMSAGKMYEAAQKREPEEIIQFTPKTVDLIVAEKKPQITNQETQTIQIVVRTKKGQQPISEMASFVTLGLPGGVKLSYDLPLTNANGMAQVEIPALKSVGNSVIIPYIVCLYAQRNAQICTTDSFLIWNYR